MKVAQSAAFLFFCRELEFVHMLSVMRPTRVARPGCADFQIPFGNTPDSKDGSFAEDRIVRVEEYKNSNKAFDLLTVRFKNWHTHEVGEKLCRVLQHVEHDECFDQDDFAKVLSKVELLFPGVEIPKNK